MSRADKTDEEAILGHSKITMNDMVEACRDEARRIQATQRALVETALRLAPDPAEIRRMDVFDATADFLERFGPHLGAFRTWIGRRTGGRG